MGLSDVGFWAMVASAGAGATASKEGCAVEDEAEASADLLDEKGQTMLNEGEVEAEDEEKEGAIWFGVARGRVPMWMCV